MDDRFEESGVGQGAFTHGAPRRSPLCEVLVVDDDPDIRETLRDVIEAEGHTVVTAANGRAALEALIMGLRPSLIVLDLMMPSLSGWDVLDALRGDRALADIPVAVMSAGGARTPPSGATCFLQKPIDLDALLDVVRDPGSSASRRPWRAAPASEARDRLPPRPLTSAG